MSPNQEPPVRRAAFESCLREDRKNINGIIKVLEAQAPGRAGAVALWELVEEYLGPQKVPDSVLESYAMELGLATGRKPDVRPVISEQKDMVLASLLKAHKKALEKKATQDPPALPTGST
jgi:hypothetical protein